MARVDPAHGGQGLPHTLGVPLNEMINAANLAWGNFPLLSHGAIEALKQHGLPVTRLAPGVPAGSELEYVDLGTIAHALVDRR